MAERTLRGSRLGAVSYETDRNAELAPRKPAEYRCPKGHVHYREVRSNSIGKR